MLSQIHDAWCATVFEVARLCSPVVAPLHSKPTSRMLSLKITRIQQNHIQQENDFLVAQ